MTIWEYSGTSRNKSVVTGYWFQEASCGFHSERLLAGRHGRCNHGFEVFARYISHASFTTSRKNQHLSRHREWSKKSRQNSVSLCQAIEVVCIGPRRCVYGAKLYRPNGERIDRCTSSLQTLHTTLQTSLFASAEDRRLIPWQITLPM